MATTKMPISTITRRSFIIPKTKLRRRTIHRQLCRIAIWLVPLTKVSFLPRFSLIKVDKYMDSPVQRSLYLYSWSYPFFFFFFVIDPEYQKTLLLNSSLPSNRRYAPAGPINIPKHINTNVPWSFSATNISANSVGILLVFCIYVVTTVHGTSMYWYT